MIKPLVVVLTIAILMLGTSGIAFAQTNTKSGGINTAIKDQTVAQKAIPINQATAISGPAIGTGITIAPVFVISIFGGKATGISNSNAFGSAASESKALNNPINYITQTGTQ